MSPLDIIQPESVQPKSDQSETIEPKAGDKKYWRSLEDLADRPEVRKFVENEFPEFADEMLTPTSRRRFLKIMGASMALAGMTACRWPREEILPFTRRPDGYVPGNAMHYATAMDLDGSATGLIITSYDGRPVKVEGNPLHPQSLGASGMWQQATMLELYDPERSQNPVNYASSTVDTDWNAFDAYLSSAIEPQAGDGSGMRVLTQASSSPSFAATKARFMAAFPNAGWHEYDANTRDNVREGVAALYGRRMRPHNDFAKAKVIVALEDDFMQGQPTSIPDARGVMKNRDPEADHFNRLYAIESTQTVTGSVADHRTPVAAKHIPKVAGCLAAFLVLEKGLALPSGLEGLRSELSSYQSNPVYKKLQLDIAGEDLYAHRGESLVTAGANQSAEVHAMVHLINRILGNVGNTVRYTEDPNPSRPHHVDDLRDLTNAMRAGSVETLVILGGNPVFDAPADQKFADGLAKVKNSVHLSIYRNETSVSCSWHLPMAHFLESWSDARGYDGTYSVVQPLIEPLFEGRTPAELLAMMTRQGEMKGYEIVRSSFASFAEGASMDRAWREALHDGLVNETRWPAIDPGAPRSDWLSGFNQQMAAADGGWEVVFNVGSLHDGRFANNGWLMELPEPISKLTWDNAAILAPASAEELGVKTTDVISVTVGGASVNLPVYVVPGQAKNSISVSLGYGRTESGSVGNGAGVDVYPIRSSDGMWRADAQVSATGETYPLSATQDHFILEQLGQDERQKRTHDLVREVEFAAYHHDPEHAMHHGHEIPDYKLWEPPIEYDGYKWGMAIDLNACNGCSACVIACQSENNIPVVGKEEVSRGREMQWLRVDRYFSGNPDSPQINHQPLPCQHCETAPCEQVCPVAATIHDEEGINVMVYNRCIGTRYCSNNCPFKVRRFNYFNNHKNEDAVQMMVYNPEVTVRSRGVMEKCTYCIQRISTAKIDAKNAKREVVDGEVLPACATACPTQAISFGNMNDSSSQVMAAKDSHRNYTLLDVLNVKPRTSYLARVRNSNEKVGGGHADDHSSHGTT